MYTYVYTYIFLLSSHQEKLLFLEKRKEIWGIILLYRCESLEKWEKYLFLSLIQCSENIRVENNHV